ncbi:hypothetical protein [Leptospira stimsonii]|nr:hypothetical protein [Leptospira stimsonii]
MFPGPEEKIVSSYGAWSRLKFGKVDGTPDKFPFLEPILPKDGPKK